MKFDALDPAMQYVIRNIQDSSKVRNRQLVISVIHLLMGSLTQENMRQVAQDLKSPTIWNNVFDKAKTHDNQHVVMILKQCHRVANFMARQQKLAGASAQK